MSERCREAFDRRDHAVIGISPFNRYFSEERIRTLADWGLQRFKTIHLFVPDVASAYTLMALGYSPHKARRKARRQANYLRNKIFRALEALGVTGPRAHELILDQNALVDSARYRYALEGVSAKFENDARFRRDCLECSRWVLDKRIPTGVEIDATALTMAARYFLVELPLFVDSVGILEQTSSVFCYHRSNRFLDDLYRGRSPLRVAGGQGFVVLPAADAATEAA